MDEELRNQDECCQEGPRPDCGCDGSLLVSSNSNTFSSGATLTYNTTTTGLFYNSELAPSKMKDVIIKQMDYGFLVKIGCQTLCIESPKKLLRALKKYMKDPDGVENEHMQGEFMKGLE